MLPTFHYKGKVYTLKPKFITELQDYFRKVKLSWYKKRKVNESKTPHTRYYHMKFKINMADDNNAQVSDFVYEMVIPAKAAFFSKILLERSIREKISVDVIDWDEMDDSEHEEFLKSKEEFLTRKKEEQLKSVD